MNFKEKVKFVLKHPLKTLNKIFSDKEERVLNFFVNNYLGKEPTDIFNSLEEYWITFRFWEKIQNIIRIKDQNFKKNRILDVGCGYTSILNILPKTERYGIDIIIDGLKKKCFNLKKDITWLNGNAENLPFGNGFFDIIFSSNSLDHFEDPIKALKEIKRVLKQDGFFILTLDVFKDNISYRNKLHPHSYTEEILINELEDFKIILKENSKINAQFSNYFKKGSLKISNEQIEIILVLKKKVS